MGLNHDFTAAKKKIDALNGAERDTLLAVCGDIQQAQQALTRKAAPLLAHCMAQCHGLCCRNIRPGDIITVWDLVYILAAVPWIESAMETCVENESFFPADCIFLADGTGPCLFPDNVRPERCVISFCRVESSVEKEIGQVMRGFNRLTNFFRWRRIRNLRSFHSRRPCKR
jgi:hypothetical protein